MSKKKKNVLFYRYLMLIISLFVYAVNYNLIMKPLSLVAGGTNGLAVVMESAFGIDSTLFLLLFYIATAIFGFITVGFKKSVSAIVSTIVYPLFVFLTSSITDLIPIDQTHVLVSCVFAGIINGWVYGVTCKIDLSQGGTVLLSQIIYEKFNISISKSNFAINLAIVLFGGYFFGINGILYSIILLYVCSSIVDKVLLGISMHKSLYIITEKEEEMRNYIVNKMNGELTIFNVKSGKDDDKKCALYVVINNDDYFGIISRIKKIDKSVFFLSTDSYEVNKCKKI